MEEISPSRDSSCGSFTTVDGLGDVWVDWSDGSCCECDVLSPAEGWQSIAHADLLSPLHDDTLAPPGAAVQEDTLHAFQARLARHQVTAQEVSGLQDKVAMIRRWLETSEAAEGRPLHASASSDCLADEEASPLDTSSDWCYVDTPSSQGAHGYWLVPRDTLPTPLPLKARLTYADLTMIDVLLTLLTGKWRAWLMGFLGHQAPPKDPPEDPDLRLLYDVLCIVDTFTQHLRPFFFHSFRTGDVIFYDLHARWRLGAERPSLALQLQKFYDPFSHSGLFLWDTGVPKVLHNLKPRLKACNWKDGLYMARREVDLYKVFPGLRFLPNTACQEVHRRYREAVVARARHSPTYVVENLSFLRGLQYLCTPRQYVPNPPGMLRTQTTRPPAEAPPGQSYTAMMCAGFTAGLLMECMKEVQAAFPPYREELAFSPTFLIDVDHMTPKDLHGWGIWRDGLRRGPLHDIVHPEVFANRARQISLC